MTRTQQIVNTALCLGKIERATDQTAIQCEIRRYTNGLRCNTTAANMEHYQPDPGKAIAVAEIGV